MNELIRSTIHDALDVQEPAGLRSRVIGDVPMDRRRRITRWGPPALNLQWAAGLAAVVITAALLAGLIGSRFAIRPVTTKPIGPAVRLTNPSGIAVAPDGTVYVADYSAGRIFHVQPNGTLVSVAGGGLQAEGPGPKSNIFGPLQIAFSPSGDLYVGEDGGSRISRLNGNRNLSIVVSTFGPVLGLAFSSSGALFASTGQVGTVLPACRSPIDLSSIGGPKVWPGYLAFDVGDNLYIADMAPVTTSIDLTPPAPGGCRILRVLPDNEVSVIAGTGHCGFSGDGGPATQAQIGDPRGIAFDSAGNLYFADSHNNRIRRIDTRGVITTIAGNGNGTITGDGGQALNAGLAYLSGIAIAQGRYLYVSEQATAGYGAVRLIDLRTGVIRMVVDSYSRVS